MANFKYLIIECSDGIETPIIFSKLIQHKDLAARLCIFANMGKVVSAGFFKISTYEIRDRAFNNTGFSFECYGESVGLKIKSRPEDSGIIQKDYNFKI